MKNIARRLSSRGFTLIELLIVIALLGALAVGLLATIDPFEQLKKGRDTSQRNTVSAFYNANLRYYATKGLFPIGVSGASDKALNQMTDAVNDLINAGELKDKFMDLAGTGNLSHIFITTPDATHISVCFTPESKSFQNDPNTIYSDNGQMLTSQQTGAGSCKSYPGGDQDCAFCIQ